LSGNPVILSPEQIKTFDSEGYLVVPLTASDPVLGAIKASAVHQMANPVQPLELEAELAYPGAPSLAGQGASTIRRIKGAYARESSWRGWAESDAMKRCLRQLFNDETLYLTQAHHNCLMTKAPQFSSDTGWHQDIRYWSFEKPNLITAWLALGDESPENGGLKLVPGSHKMLFEQNCFDDKRFFLAELAKNSAVLAGAKTVHLNAGDVLFFHCNLLHAASRNYSSLTKLALVLTYHSSDTAPLPGTRSSSIHEIRL